MKRSWAWGILLVPLAVLLVASLLVDRSTWPSFIGDEATYAMEAGSLANDFDLAYEAEDYHRFRQIWQLPPQGLILQSGDGGEFITFGKPFFYPLYLAPFLYFSPHQGAFVANAILLIFTALFVAYRLEKRFGVAAPIWVASLIFGSVAFVYTFWMHADLFLMCLTAIALSLVLVPSTKLVEETRISHIGWAVAGVLLAMVAFSRPLYAPLFLPALLAAPPPRWRKVGLLLASALGLFLLTAAVHYNLTGSWTGYGALRSGFYEHTGYPDVDFSAQEWTENIHQLGNAAARTPLQTLREKKMPISLAWWNSVYFFLGRHIGLVPYFFPILIAFWVFPSGHWRWGLLLAVAVSVAAFLWTRPFNFYGGGGTIANRYFLPLFPALWFLPRKLPKPWILLIALAFSGLFISGLWRNPAGFPITEEGDYSYVSPTAQQLLPFETSQSHLRLAGREDLYGDFYVRFISPSLQANRQGLIRLEAGQTGTLLIGSPKPLERIEIFVKHPLRSRFEIAGGRTHLLSQDGEPLRISVKLDDPIARHPLWWTWNPVSLYRLQLTFATGSHALFELHLPSATEANGTRESPEEQRPSTTAPK